jgi:hypothetical protein
MKRVVLLAALACQFSSAQTWSNFNYFGDSEKTNFDIDEGSIRVSANTLTLWARLRPKDPSTSYYAILDKLHIRCTDYQYTISTRRTVDQGGKLIKEHYDLPDSALKWTASLEGSIIRRIGARYCISSGHSSRPSNADDGWLSLGLGSSGNSEFTYFLNPTKNKINGDELTYFSKILYSAEQKSNSGKLYKVVLSENIINCQNSTYVTLKSEAYNSSNVLVDSSFVSKEFANFRPMTPSSFAGRIREKYCTSPLFTSNEKKEEVRAVPMITLDGEKCEKLGFKKSTPPFERCIKQLSESK